MAREFKKSMSQKLRMAGRDYARPGWYFLTLGADYHRQLIRSRPLVSPFGRLSGVTPARARCAGGVRSG